MYKDSPEGQQSLYDHLTMIIQTSTLKSSAVWEDTRLEWFQIKQVSQQTGLSAQLIRKWEQRYKAVNPRRLNNRYREYSASDVERLKSIKRLVDDGISVRRAVDLVRERESHAPARVDGHPSAAPYTTEMLSESGTMRADGNELMDESLAKLIEAGERGWVSMIDEALSLSFAEYGLSVVIDTLILPFLRNIGELWESGRWSEDQEHLSSLATRDFIVRRMRDLPDPPSHAPTLLCSCIPGERHDIMLNIAMLEARRFGWFTLFLGPDPAPNALFSAVHRLQPNVVLLSVSTNHTSPQTPPRDKWFRELDVFATHRPDTRFLIGGPQPIVESYLTDLYHVHAVYHLASFYRMLTAPQESIPSTR